MDNMTLPSIIFDGGIIDVFNKHLDIYSLFLLSKNVQKIINYIRNKAPSSTFT